jgi:hypothetical protein
MLKGRSAYPGLLIGTGALNLFTKSVALRLLSLLTHPWWLRDLLIHQVDQPALVTIQK